MDTVIELYCRDQIIRGELPTDQGRPLDLLNSTLQRVLLLQNASVLSLYHDGEPMAVGAARVQKEQILLAIPYDAPKTPGKFRGGWVDKKPVRVVVGVGPLTVTGTLHFGKWDESTLEMLGRDDDGRSFLPATEASITLLYRADWSIVRPTVLLSRAAIEYWSPLSTVSERSLNPEAVALEEFYRRFRPVGPSARATG